jgi:hypothetical protein
MGGFHAVVGPPSEKYYSVGPQVRTACGGEEQYCSYRGSHSLITLTAAFFCFLGT